MKCAKGQLSMIISQLLSAAGVSMHLLNTVIFQGVEGEKDCSIMLRDSAVYSSKHSTGSSDLGENE